MLPFNQYSWLTTHNSFARLGLISGTGDAILAYTNQENSVTSQLQAPSLNYSSLNCIKTNLGHVSFLKSTN